MGDYRDRLRQGIQMTSPDGAVFNALWIGNDAPQSKKVGIFNFPQVDGSVVQDNGTVSTTYNLTIYFEGPNNDLVAQAFMRALSERGAWEVIHPVLGLKKLQPLVFTPDWQPVTSGNLTKIETEWIEPLDLAALPSAAELQAAIAAQVDEVNDVAAEQLEQSTFQKIAAEVGAFRKGVLDVVSSVEDKLEAISNFSAAVTAEMEAIKRDINRVLEVLPLDVISTAGQLQELIQLPARAINDVSSRIDAYKNFADDISFSLSPDRPGTDSYNSVAIQELALTAVFGAVSEVSGTGTLLSRAESVELIEANTALFNDSTNTLDSTQALFDDEPIDRQYFSQSQSYPASAKLNALTVAYLLRSAFDLKTEKRFVLERSRNPVMVAMEEYGGPGEDDANVTLFVDSNKLEGDEHLIMPKGRELVVYV
jgi:tetrahydromethanopterin S-methyltransferase subunit B